MAIGSWWRCRCEQVAVIDIRTMQVAQNISVGAYPQEVVVRPDGKTAYVSCMHSNQVAEIDLGSWKVTRMIATGERNRRAGLGRAVSSHADALVF